LTGFIAELGKKAAERWLALLVLPGALLFAFAWTTWTTRQHGSWFDPTSAAHQAERWSGARPGTLLLAAAAVLLAAAGIALLAQGLASAVEHLWFEAGWGPAGRLLTERRRSNWQDAENRYQATLRSRLRGDRSADPDAALARRDRICLVEPARPTWLADRVRAVGVRVYDAYDLDLDSLWPRLWLALPDAARSELAAARTSLTADARLFAWGLLYFLPSLWWPPALAVTAVTCTTAWRRARGSTNTLADLAEASVDLYTPTLATHLGLAAEKGLTLELGLQITTILRKDARGSP
jgi:hypothetical protein